MNTINKDLLLQTATELAEKYAQYRGEDMAEKAAFYARISKQLQNKLESEQA